MEKEQEIIQKARELFMTYGLRSITMDDLAKQIGISKKTLYLHFKDKADLIHRIVFDEVERVMQQMNKLFESSKNSIELMIKINKYLVGIRKKTPVNVEFDLRKYYPEISEDLKKHIETKMFEAVKRNHDLGKKEGYIRQEVDTNTVSALQVFRSSFMPDMVTMLDIDYETALNQLFDYHIHAVATPKGLKYYCENYKTIK